MKPLLCLPGRNKTLWQQFLDCFLWKLHSCDFQDVSRALLKFDPFNKKHITQFMLEFSGLFKNNYEMSMCARKAMQTSLRMGRQFV